MNDFVDFLIDHRHDGAVVLDYYGEKITAMGTQKYAEAVDADPEDLDILLWCWKYIRKPAVRKAAQTSGLSFHVLVKVAKHIYFLKNKPNITHIITRLYTALAGATITTCRGITESFLQDLSREEGVKRHPDSAHFHTRLGKDNKKVFTARLSPHRHAHMRSILNAKARKIMHAADEPIDYSQALAQALYTSIANPSGDDPQPIKFQPMFMIATDLNFHADGRLATTHGELVNIADIIDEELAPFGWATITATHPNGHKDAVMFYPVTQNPNDRFANNALTLASILNSPTCAWPTCNIPAINCEAHHIHSWARGGKTTPENITSLCPSHNGKNVDDETKLGRIERDPATGYTGLRLTENEPLIPHPHPIHTKSLRAYINYCQKE